MVYNEENARKDGHDMYYKEFQGERLSALGFGAMRLPTNADGSVNEELTEQMVALAFENGVNYFDTAYPYHGGMSERIIGKILSKYPRESFYLANKFPGHQIQSSYDPAAIFEEQLRRCKVEYFDFYLLHNVYENSFQTYLDPQWGIFEYLREQKRLGRIRHLGMSSHARPEFLEKILDILGDDLEFCLIQLNYLDWTLQDAKKKYDLLTARGIPVWVMEPVRGGKLAKLSDADEAKLKAIQPEKSIASWGFRFLQGLPNVTVTLSGMSDLSHVKDNLATYAVRQPLSEGERELVFDIAEGMKNTIPCTSCRYCCDGCPMGLDIPMLLSVCNDLRFAPVVNTGMLVEFLPEDKKPSACIACGKCTKICPQGIDIPGVMAELADRLDKLPKWVNISREREEEQKRNNARV